MNDLSSEQRRWLIAQFKDRGRGAKSALARHLRLRPDAVTRMTSARGEERRIGLNELIGMAEFFAEEPPGLAAARRAAADAARPVKFISVPVLDYVQAGKLVAPHSQLPVEDVPLLAFADLGPGDWFALKVQGTSMDRVSPEGSTIIVNKRDRTPVSGRCFVFAVDGEVTYKRWQGGDPPYLEPFSTDPQHRPRFFKRRDLEVIGRVKRTLLDL